MARVKPKTVWNTTLPLVMQCADVSGCTMTIAPRYSGHSVCLFHQVKPGVRRGWKRVRP
jgi:hypothetical protein